MRSGETNLSGTLEFNGAKHMVHLTSCRTLSSDKLCVQSDFLKNQKHFINRSFL